MILIFLCSWMGEHELAMANLSLRGSVLYGYCMVNMHHMRLAAASGKDFYLLFLSKRLRSGSLQL